MLREHAIELIDSLVKGELRQTIMPILTEESPQKKAEIGRRIFRLSGNLEQALSDTLFQADPWLKCCLLAWIKGRRQVRAERARGGCLRRPKRHRAGDRTLGAQYLGRLVSRSTFHVARS